MDLETASSPEGASPPAESAASEGTRSATADAYDRLVVEQDRDVVDAGDAAEPAEPERRASQEAQRSEPKSAPETQALKAPADWRPGAKAHWEKLPPAVKEEALRLHSEVKKTLQESADARKEVAAWREASAPHAQFFETAGVTPAQAFGELAGMYARLSTGQPQERVQIVADLIRQFVGTDESSITALAEYLDGGTSAHGARAVAPPAAQMEAMAQERAQAIIIESSRRDALADWAAFEATKPDLLPRVRMELATTVSVIRQQKAGERLTVDDFRRAYYQACRLNPEVAPIIAQREAAAAAEKSNAEYGRRSAASSGIKSEPAGPSSSSKPLSTREQVALEFAKASGRKRI